MPEDTQQGEVEFIPTHQRGNGGVSSLERFAQGIASHGFDPTFSSEDFNKYPFFEIRRAIIANAARSMIPNEKIAEWACQQIRIFTTTPEGSSLLPHLSHDDLDILRALFELAIIEDDECRVLPILIEFLDSKTSENIDLDNSNHFSDFYKLLVKKIIDLDSYKIYEEEVRSFIVEQLERLEPITADAWRYARKNKEWVYPHLIRLYRCIQFLGDTELLEVVEGYVKAQEITEGILERMGGPRGLRSDLVGYLELFGVRLATLHILQAKRDLRETLEGSIQEQQKKLESI